MKIIIRTLIILVAALVVAGIAGALNSAGAFGNLGPLGRGGFEDGRAFNGQPPTDGTRPNFEQGSGFQRGGFGRGGGDREGRGGVSLFGLAEVVKNLGIMAVITVVIVSASKLFKQLRPNRRASPPSAASTL